MVGQSRTGSLMKILVYSTHRKNGLGMWVGGSIQENYQLFSSKVERKGGGGEMYLVLVRILNKKHLFVANRRQCRIRHTVVGTGSNLRLLL